MSQGQSLWSSDFPFRFIHVYGKSVEESVDTRRSATGAVELLARVEGYIGRKL